jgi:hypothetical protein
METRLKEIIAEVIAEKGAGGALVSAITRYVETRRDGD